MGQWKPLVSALALEPVAELGMAMDLVAELGSGMEMELVAELGMAMELVVDLAMGVQMERGTQPTGMVQSHSKPPPQPRLPRRLPHNGLRSYQRRPLHRR